MNNNLAQLVAKITGKNILTVGDMVADVYLHGDIDRISREAPVLVLSQAGETTVAGGAANVVHNVRTLGGSSYTAGIIGVDASGEGLVDVLDKACVNTDGLFKDYTRTTITKTRIIAGGRATVSQQIVRIDREDKTPLHPAMEAELLAYIERTLPEMDGVVLSDYGAGTLTTRITERTIYLARELHIPSIVDSRYDILRFRGVHYVKQNDAELAAAVGRKLLTENDLYDAGDELLKKIAADGILVTRGGAGMTLFEKNGSVTHIPVTDKSEVFDVSGAGDTCVATFILALTAGAMPVTAARLSNYASGIAVRKLGTATVSNEELSETVARLAPRNHDL